MSDTYDGLDSSYGDTPAGSAPTSPDQSPAPPDHAAGATPGPEGETESASDGRFVPSHRLREETQRRQRIEAAYEALTAHVQSLQAQLSRQSGPAPPQVEDPPEVQRIREQFGRIFPGLTKLADVADQLQAMVQQAPNWEANSQHYWTAVGNEFLGSLRTAAKEVYGEQPIPPRARRALETAFIDFVENDPHARSRYLSRDLTLAADFWKDIRSQMLDPVRRTAAQAMTQRGQRVARVPQPGPAAPPPHRQAPKPKTEDELHDAAFAALSSQLGMDG